MFLCFKRFTLITYRHTVLWNEVIPNIYHAVPVFLRVYIFRLTIKTDLRRCLFIPQMLQLRLCFCLSCLSVYTFGSEDFHRQVILVNAYPLNDTCTSWYLVIFFQAILYSVTMYFLVLSIEHLDLSWYNAVCKSLTFCFVFIALHAS